MLHESPDSNAAAGPFVAGDGQAATAPEMLDAVASYIRRYLVCTDHQCDMLALWTVYTWCAPAFSTSPFLHICSAERQSGKSVCLKLLSMLCYTQYYGIYSSPGVFVETMLFLNLKPDKRPVVLLDDCHDVLTGVKGEPATLLLSASFNKGSCYTSRGENRKVDEYELFCPKAFAGSGHLPASLADCCIPIRLKRRKPSEPVQRFSPDEARELAQPLRIWLARWDLLNTPSLARNSLQEAEGLSPLLSPRQQDCVVPLLHLANFIGGDWPQKAQAAIAALLPVTRSQDQSLSLRLLSDVRDAFLSRSNPEYVSSADLLEFLNRLDHGMWNAYRKGAPLNAHLLSQILRPFEVFSRTRRQDRATVIRVYLRDDFADAWSRYLPPLDLSHELDAEDAESFAVEEPDAQESGCSNSPIATATSIATGNRQC